MYHSAYSKILRHPRITYASLLLIILLGSAGGVFLLQKSDAVTPTQGPLSRQLVNVEEGLIRLTKPAPTLAALQYAYVTSVYNDVLAGSSQADALFASGSMLTTLFPNQSSSITQSVKDLAKINNIEYLSGAQSPKAASILQSYKNRYAHDGHDLVWNGVIPTGVGKWKQTTAVSPFTPRAGDWQRWVVTQAITVLPPPTIGSAADNAQINIVEQAVASRNGEDVNMINFWGGTPGSETPAGIWQNVAFNTLHKQLSTSAAVSDKQYALLQKNLAQTISDAFMECWKVKYTYWSARPDMRIPGLKVAMHDPNFPGYISGHSTISKAAADVLGVMAPRYAKDWQAFAVQARNSRLVAGIHFDIDNSEGFAVGDNVGNQAIQTLQARKIIN